MTVLSAMQSAAIRLIGRKPTTFFSSTQGFEQEIVDLANEVAKSIADQHDWNALLKTYTLTGDGVTTTFPLPPDYDRMLLDGSIYDATNWAWGYQRIVRADEFLYLQVRDFSIITPGFWTMLGNEFQFLPAPNDQAQAKFLYVTKNIVSDENGDLKDSFTTDSDSFVLDERLLTLGLIWRWKEQKKMDAGSDQANFDTLFSDLSGRDGGSKPIRTPARRWPAGLRLRGAYPWPLG